MPITARKVNFTIDEEIWRDLSVLVPAGQRSRVVNEALRKELAALRRTELSRRLLDLRRQGGSLSDDEIVDELGKDRGRSPS